MNDIFQIIQQQYAGDLVLTGKCFDPNGNIVASVVMTESPQGFYSCTAAVSGTVISSIPYLAAVYQGTVQLQSWPYAYGSTVGMFTQFSPGDQTILSPTPGSNQVNGTVVITDDAGNPRPWVPVQFRFVGSTSTNTAGTAFSLPVTAYSNAMGVLTVALEQSSTYVAKFVNGNDNAPFNTPTNSTAFQIPQITIAGQS